MLEVIKPLLDSDLVNEETRNQISEAWDKYKKEGGALSSKDKS